jgi:hypothetical protein
MSNMNKPRTPLGPIRTPKSMPPGPPVQPFRPGPANLPPSHLPNHTPGRAA